MKIFISADIEGTAGIAHWNETEPSKGAEYTPFAKRMAREVAAVCEGINAAKKDAFIYVKDAHGSARNIDHELLPENVTLCRSFAGHPDMMMFGIDKTYDGSMVTGYHGPASYNGNPLAHTMAGKYAIITINGLVASEFLINYYNSLFHGVPMVLASGDRVLMAHINDIDKDIITVESMHSTGSSVTSPHPQAVRNMLTDAAKRAVANTAKLKKMCGSKLPKKFDVEIRYKEHMQAFRASWYPGAVAKDSHTITFTTADYFDVLRLILFV